jgi:hypothetical protein
MYEDTSILLFKGTSGDVMVIFEHTLIDPGLCKSWLVLNFSDAKFFEKIFFSCGK